MNIEIFIRKWKKIRSNGKRRYILISGITMGLSMFTGSIIGNLLKTKTLIMVAFWHRHFPYFLGGFAGGLIGAFIRWNRNEEKYNELINDNS